MGLGGFIPPTVAELHGEISDFREKFGVEAPAIAGQLEGKTSGSFNKMASVGKTAFLGIAAGAAAVAVVGVKMADAMDYLMQIASFFAVSAP